MLESINQGWSNMVLPQAKATANRNFSNARNAPVAKAFTKFCKILEALNRRE